MSKIESSDMHDEKVIETQSKSPAISSIILTDSMSDDGVDNDDFEEIPDLVAYDPNEYEEDEEEYENEDVNDDLIKDSDENTTTLPTDSTISPYVQGEKRVTPLTLLTGWLGSGKTTLLHHILESFSNSGKTVAILQNETSEMMGVEKALRIQDDSGIFGEVLELANGCMCCSVRSNFMLAVETLLSARTFDYVVVECSGIADPGKLANMFWVDDELESKVYLDGVLTVIDASLITSHLQKEKQYSSVVMAQIAYADKVILNKCDIVDNETLEKAKIAISELNANAPIITSTRSVVDIDQILHIRTLRLNENVRKSVERALQLPTPTSISTISTTAHEHDTDDQHHCNDTCTHGEDVDKVEKAKDTKNAKNDPTTITPDYEHEHVKVYKTKSQSGYDHDISTIVLSSTIPSLQSSPSVGISLQKLKLWLDELLFDEGQVVYDQDIVDIMNDTRMSIFRTKAVLAVADAKERHYLQSVQATYDVSKADVNERIDIINPTSNDYWDMTALRESRMIVIGINLDIPRITKGFADCFQ